MAFKLFPNLNGGLDTRETPLVIEIKSKEKMLSPSLRNVDLFATGAISKRLGKTKQGATISGGATWASQLVNNNTSALTASASRNAWCQKIVAPSTTTILSLTVNVCMFGTTNNSRAVIKADSAGEPGATIANGTSSNQLLPSALANVTYTFPIPPSVTSMSTYWFCIESVGPVGSSFRIGSKSGATGNVHYTTNDYNNMGTDPIATDLYYIIQELSSTSAIQGVYDYRSGSASTQKQVAVAGGQVYWNNAGTWASLINSLSSGQDNLYDFATLKNLMFSADNGVNTQRVWDGAAAYTIAHGFRATFTLTDSAAAGTVPVGDYYIMPVTTLISGGFRAGTPTKVTVGGANNHQIVVGSIVMNGTGASNFGFDIAALATTWYMTDVNGAIDSIYYKIPTGNCSASNPAANSTTTFNITATTGLTASTTLLTDYDLEQGYFTSQINTPVCKYLAVWQGMLVMAGDATNPSRVWFSEVNAPNIWSTFGSLQGAFEDLNTNDGEVLTGIRVDGEYIYPSKRHSFFICRYTQNDSQPFMIRQISKNIGNLSHWSSKSISGVGLVFMSQRGPAFISGTSVQLFPASARITDRFDPNNANRYNLSAMAFTTCGINVTKSQIHWGVSSTSATVRDLTLVLDYANMAFWENDVSANFYTEVTDSSFFPFIWSGDYSAQVFKMDYGTNDNGSAISFSFSTPWVQFGNPFNSNEIINFHCTGNVQSSGILNVDVYTDFGTSAVQSFTLDMSDANFKQGLAMPLGLICGAAQFKITNNQLDVPVQVDSIGFSFENLGEDYGSA